MCGAISKTKIAREKCVKAGEAIKRYGYVYVVGFLHRVMYVLHLLLISHTTGDLGFRIY